MKVTNRGQQTILFQLFNDGDIMAATQAGVPLDSKTYVVKANESVTVNPSGGVQIKILLANSPELVSGIFVGNPATLVLNQPLINASRSRIFQDTDDVVLTNWETLVKLDDNYRYLVGLVAVKPNSTSVPDATKITKAVLTVAEALVVGIWGDTYDEKKSKFMPAGVFKIALGLADIFSPPASTNSLSLKDIQTIVQGLIDQNEARLRVGDIFDVADWLDKYVQKSRALAVGVTDPLTSTVELSQYDREHFWAELKNHYDGVTPFKSAMTMYRNNRDIRKYAMPAYILGVLLHLHIELLTLYKKQETTPLDQADITAVARLTEAYSKTMEECTADYDLFCEDWATKYPLLSRGDLKNYGFPDIIIVASDEANALCKAVVKKYLQGDRMLLVNARSKISDFLQATERMRSKIPTSPS
jgi:hypothetical protein